MKMMLIAAVMITLPAIAVLVYGVLFNAYTIWPVLAALLAGGFPFVLAAIWLGYNKRQGQEHGADELHH